MNTNETDTKVETDGVKNFPSSVMLISMAETEWENREARRNIHDKISWTTGWISGYLTAKGE